MRATLARVTAILCLTAVYVVCGRFGLSLALVHASASAVWPPTGLALAALLLWGRHLWPAIFVGAFLVNFSIEPSWTASLAIATGNTIEALVGAWLVNQFAKGTDAFEHPRSIFRFIILAALLATTISATLGVTTLCVHGFAAWHDYRAIWLTWWIGDMVSDLVLTPLLIVWLRKRPPSLTSLQLLEMVWLLCALLAIGQLVFIRTTAFALTYLALLPLLWAAFRFGLHGATTAGLAISALALWGTLNSRGPFVNVNPHLSVLLLQAFVGTTTLTGLLLAAITSERQQAEQALRENEEKFRTLADNMSQLAWMADPAGSIFWYNQRWFDYTGASPQEMQGQGWKQVYHPDHLERVVTRMQHSWDTGELWEDTFPLRSKDGNYRWFLSRALPIRDSDGKVVRWLGTNTDVTEQRTAEEALRIAQHQVVEHATRLEQTVAERTVKLRETVDELESYSYSISHDMRAPLRAMQAYAQVLLSEYRHCLDDAGKRYLDRIINSSARLDKLIQDVLSYSRISRADVRLEPGSSRGRYCSRIPGSAGQRR